MYAAIAFRRDRSQELDLLGLLLVDPASNGEEVEWRGVMIWFISAS